MALNFPTSPTLNQVYTSGSYSWTWDGTTWKSNSSGLSGYSGISGYSGAINSTDILIAANYDVGVTTAASDSIALDFSAGTGLFTRAVAGNVTFTASNYRAGAIKTVRLVADASTRTLTFPASWVWMGSKPTSIAATKTGILSVTSFGTTEANCVATWTVQI